MELAVFVVAAAMVLAGAVGVVVSRSPVHSALMLVLTLFGVAVLFVQQQADFLAAVQVIVYAGAIVVLFLFVIMLLGVERADSLAREPLTGQRPVALAAMAAVVGAVLVGIDAFRTSGGERSVSGALSGEGSNIEKLARATFTGQLFAFEATSALLVIAVVGAVVLARREQPPGDAPVADQPDSREPAPAEGGPR